MQETWKVYLETTGWKRMAFAERAMVASMVNWDGIGGRASTVEEKPGHVTVNRFGLARHDQYLAPRSSAQNQMASRLLVVTAVATAVLAYSNTAPVVAWSSSQYVSIGFSELKG